MSEHKCVNLALLEGELNKSGKYYFCRDCKKQFRVEPLEIGVEFGMPPLEPSHAAQAETEREQ